MNFCFTPLFLNLLYNINLHILLFAIFINPSSSITTIKRQLFSFVPYEAHNIPKRTSFGQFKNSKLFSRDSRVSYLAEERFYKMINDKYYEVDDLTEKHKDPNDKLQLRLNFLQCTSNLKLSDMLKRNSNRTHHKLCLIGDMKRRTPTHNPKCDNNVLSYSNAAEVALTMASVGFDVIFVNTDQINYGGHINDLHKTFLHLRKLGRRQRPAIVMKDIILHPIQIAQAAEFRADGVLLNAAILGNALQEFFNVCSNMGIEAIVEVHTPNDALRAVDMGFTNILINQWDRVSNTLFPNRALEVMDSLPEHVTTIAAGGIMTMEQIHKLALAGFDAVCLGRRLIYPDVPDFVKQVKSWKGPPKPILKMSKYKFFNYTETPSGTVNITLRDDHKALLDEMNYFYFGSGNEVNLSDEIENLNQIDYRPPNPAPLLTDEQKSREIIINMGTPTSEDAPVKVTDLTKTVEGQDKDFDINVHNHERRVEIFKMKWYMDKKKWIKENIQSYQNEQEASDAYDLKKAIEMYNSFRYVTKPNIGSVLTKEEILETERDLLKIVQTKYEAAPKVNGKVNLNFDTLESPPETPK